LHGTGIELCFAELKDPVKDKLKRFWLFPQIGERFFFPTIGVAVSSYLEEAEREERPVAGLLSLRDRLKSSTWPANSFTLRPALLNIKVDAALAPASVSTCC
jgi:hypothetical protein